MMTYRNARRALALCGVLALAGCLDVSQVPDVPSNPATEHFSSTLGIDSGLKSFTKTTNGVYYKDTQIGTGAKLDTISVVLMSFQTYLTNGTLIDEVPPQSTFDMHAIKVAGLIEGMLGYGATGGMLEGGTRIIIVPSELAYANQPQGSIPANATLIFFVTLQTIG